MTNITSSTTDFKNRGCPFTELFSVLKRYEILSEIPMLAYETEELKTIHQHVENSMGTLLQGLQEVGHLISATAQDEKRGTSDLNTIGHLIATISNLTEALNILRADADYELKKRGELDY